MFSFNDGLLLSLFRRNCLCTYKLPNRKTRFLTIAEKPFIINYVHSAQAELSRGYKFNLSVRAASAVLWSYFSTKTVDMLNWFRTMETFLQNLSTKLFDAKLALYRTLGINNSFLCLKGRNT